MIYTFSSNFFRSHHERITPPIGYAEYYEGDSGLIIYRDYLNSREWRTAQDPEGNLYFYNEDNESFWNLPKLDKIEKSGHCLILDDDEGPNAKWSAAYIIIHDVHFFSGYQSFRSTSRKACDKRIFCVDLYQISVTREDKSEVLSIIGPNLKTFQLQWDEYFHEWPLELSGRSKNIK